MEVVKQQSADEKQHGGKEDDGEEVPRELIDGLIDRRQKSGGAGRRMGGTGQLHERHRQGCG